MCDLFFISGCHVNAKDFPRITYLVLEYCDGTHTQRGIRGIQNTILNILPPSLHFVLILTVFIKYLYSLVTLEIACGIRANVVILKLLFYLQSNLKIKENTDCVNIRSDTVMLIV